MKLNAIYFYFNYRPSCPAIYEETEKLITKKKKKKRKETDRQKKEKKKNLNIYIYIYMFLWFNSYGFFCQRNTII